MKKNKEEVLLLFFSRVVFLFCLYRTSFQVVSLDEKRFDDENYACEGVHQ